MKRNVQIIGSIVLVMIVLAGCGKLFRYLLTDDVSSYTRVAFHEMYEQDNIDVLFVGSSHIYRSCVPQIFDEAWHVNSFNAGTSSQKMDGSYMVIREAARYHNISHIYLDLYYEMAFDVQQKRTQMTDTYIIADYLKPSVDKIDYLLHASGKEQYANSFIVARRNWEKIFDPDYIKDLLVKKSSQDYKNYRYTNISNENEWYVGKGYVANKIGVKNWNLIRNFSQNGWHKIDLQAISEDWLKNLSDIIRFCDRNDIELTLIAVPMSNYMLVEAGNYDDYIAYIKEFLQGTGIPYYDFNLLKEEYFPNRSDLFLDLGHVNCYGAERFSHCLAGLMNGELSEEEVFYGSYSEKLQSLNPTVFGISYYEDKETDGLWNCWILSNGAEGMEYRVDSQLGDGSMVMVRDYTSDPYFTIAAKKEGTFKIRYRLKKKPENISNIKVTIQ